MFKDAAFAAGGAYLEHLRDAKVAQEQGQGTYSRRELDSFEDLQKRGSDLLRRDLNGEDFFGRDLEVAELFGREYDLE